MTTQAMVIAETVAGMKRATASSPSSDSDESIDRSTNRGNKLKRKARYVHEGHLDRPNGPKVYKKRIEHAGYHREVISQNPKRYDENGDELDDDEEDEDADAAATEANPYSGVVLHELLAPLISAANLPVHPSLSIPYHSPILGNMTQEASAMLQRERNTIRGAKQLLTKLRGDGTWLPCGLLDSGVDEVIFDTSKVYEEITRLRPTSRLAHKENGRIVSGTIQVATENGSEHAAQVEPNVDERAGSEPPPGAPVEDDNQYKTIEVQQEQTEAASHARSDVLREENVVMQDFDNPTRTSGNTRQIDHSHGKIQVNDSTNTVRYGVASNDNTTKEAESSTAAGTSPVELGHDQEREVEREPPVGTVSDPQSLQTVVNPDEASIDKTENGPMELDGDQAADEGIQPTTHRMRTRAQAQAVSDNVTSSRERSASITSSVLPSIHPLFLVGSDAYPDRDFGLPPEEAEATRRILMSYVQKQEEVCRGAEALYHGLLKAQRMKKHVLESCKAEGHVGEMSDGEDWYDKEEWRLEEDLRKGKDEDQEDEGATQQKKTRGRRA
ncbi:MAG: hypothetical protein Q9228_001412 [Teloschistes exilis]